MKYTFTDTDANGVVTTHNIEIDDATIAALDASAFARFVAQDLAPENAAALTSVVTANIARTFPIWQAQMLDPANIRHMGDAHALDQATPRTAAPGETIAANDGAVLKVGTDGKVYRNGVRLGAAVASQGLVHGTGLYMHGQNDGKWWEWTGSAWRLLSGVVELDPAVFSP
jgi:hypothetical protein